MSEYFAKFPKIVYNQNFNNGAPNYDLVTNIFFRTMFREIAKNESVNYYLYDIKEYDTPDSVARDYYGHPEAYWMILYANDIIDPYYDWPLSGDNFDNYIIEKYGSLEYAMTTVHHYEKLITMTDSRTGTSTTKTLVIDQADARTVDGEDLPHDDYTTLAETYYPNVQGSFKDASSVTVVVTKQSVTIYDYEFNLNEAKRSIRLIRKSYYETFREQMEKLGMEDMKKPYFREIRGY